MSMKISEIVKHLRAFHEAYGDIDVYIDTDIFKDTAPRGVTSLQSIELLRTPCAFIDGHFPNEGVEHRVVIYIGNEPNYKLA
jgi:hypothetical protein